MSLKSKAIRPSSPTSTDNTPQDFAADAGLRTLLTAALSSSSGKGVSPNATSATSIVLKTGDIRIDALTFGTKWNTKGADGVTELTYSFPKEGAAWGWSYFFSREPYSNFSPLSDVQKDAFRGALKAWADVANIRFVEVDEASGKVGDLRIAFSSKGDKETTIAYGGFPLPLLPNSGDIWLGPKELKYDDIYGPGEFGFGVLLHELGHALGLKHNFDLLPHLPSQFDNTRYTIMSYTDYLGAGTTDSTTPMLYDVLAIQYLYGANPTTRTGNDVYEFTNHEFRVVWDAAGTDTFSTRNLTTDSIINLNAGEFSSIGNLWYGSSLASNNVAIAYGAVIENAIGGSGNDSIVGNAVANRLDGGLGNDTILANAGNDTVFGQDGNDFLYGGFDNDRLDGGAGNDFLWGDFGDDNLIGGAGNDLLYGGAGNDISSAGDGNDSAFASYGNDILYGNGGDDNLDGGDNNDQLFGDDGRDILYGGAGDDNITGGTGDDTLFGNDGSDAIATTSGNDLVIGGAGNDYIYLSNLGNEVVSFAQTLTSTKAANGYDWVYGFQGDAHDRLKLTEVLDAFGVGASHRVLNDAFRVVNIGGIYWQLQVDGNGDRVFETKLGAIQLVSGIWDQSDFIV